MKPQSIHQTGFAAIAAIFLVVVLAALGGFMMIFSNTQQLTSAQDFQGSRAYWAARGGLEWAIASVAATAALFLGTGCVPLTDYRKLEDRYKEQEVYVKRNKDLVKELEKQNQFITLSMKEKALRQRSALERSEKAFFEDAVSVEREKGHCGKYGERLSNAGALLHRRAAVAVNYRSGGTVAGGCRCRVDCS